VISQGETLEELQAMISDAYRLIVEDAAERICSKGKAGTVNLLCEASRAPATLAGPNRLSRGSQHLGSLTAGGVPPRRARQATPQNENPAGILAKGLLVLATSY